MDHGRLARHNRHSPQQSRPATKKKPGRVVRPGRWGEEGMLGVGTTPERAPFGPAVI